MTQYLVLYVVSLSVRSIAVAAIAGIAAWKLRSAAVRHAVWVVVLGTMLLLPVLDKVLPSSWVPVLLQHRVVAESLNFTRVVEFRSLPMAVPKVPVATPISPVFRPLNWWNVAFVLYMFLVLAMLARLVVGYRRIWSLKRTARQVSSTIWGALVDQQQMHWRTPELRESEWIQVPLTMGFFKPVVILPPDWQSWDDWKLHAVLSHEYAHVRRADWAIAAIAAIMKCVYWMNPLSWFLEKHLSELAEHASDDASLVRTGNPARYAELLLEFAAAAQSGRLMTRGVAMAHHRVQSRIERVLSNTYSGAGSLRIASWLLLATIAAPVLYSAAALQVASKPAPVTVPVAVIPQVPPPASASQPKEASPALTKEVASSQELQSARPRNPIEILAIVGQGPVVTGGRQENPSVELRNDSYVIKAMDVLSVFVYRHPELSIVVNVQPDGRISTPLVQSLQAAGLSTDQLKVAIEKRLSDVIDFPDVTVVIKPIAATASSNYRVFVVGKVQIPGAIEYEKPITVLQSLALAGGFQDAARKNEITVIRSTSGTQRSIKFNFNYDEVTSRGDVLHQNLYLESGDVVVVP